MSNNIPVLMLRGSDGKFFSVDGITGSGSGSGASAVSSVNGKTGKVVLTANDVNAVEKSTQVTSLEGTTLTLKDNTEYRLSNITSLTLKYPSSNFECWLSLSFSTSGTITVAFPGDTKYIGTAPNFSNGEEWEISIKDKTVIAQKVGDGSMTSVEDGTEVSY